jgi:hypothetical protein
MVPRSQDQPAGIRHHKCKTGKIPAPSVVEKYWFETWRIEKEGSADLLPSLFLCKKI